MSAFIAMFNRYYSFLKEEVYTLSIYGLLSCCMKKPAYAQKRVTQESPRALALSTIPEQKPMPKSKIKAPRPSLMKPTELVETSGGEKFAAYRKATAGSFDSQA